MTLVSVYYSCILLDSEGWRKLYYRGDKIYNTTYFPLSTLVYYVLMNALGHVYVQTSNLNFERKHLFYSQHMRNTDFIFAVCVAPVFWLFSAIMVLRSPYSISSTLQCSTLTTTDPDTLLETSQTVCLNTSFRYTWWECFKYN